MKYRVLFVCCRWWALATASLAQSVVANTPTFELTGIPAYRTFNGALQGSALGLTPADYRVVTYLRVSSGWWGPKPSWGTTTPIDSKGVWSSEVDSGGIDFTATEFKAYLVPSSYDTTAVGYVAGDADLPAELGRFRVLGVVRNDVVAPQPPPFSTQPQSQVVQPGTAATFSVAVVGTAPVTVQWRKNGTFIPGASGTSYVIASTQAGDAGQYSVVVSNGYGSSTSSYGTLVVNSDSTLPQIVVQPRIVGEAPQPFRSGATTYLNASALSNGQFNLQWRCNGVAIPGATNEWLINPNITPDNAGTYDLVATNANGSVLSSAVTMAVSPPSGYACWTLAGMAENFGMTDGRGRDARFWDPEQIAFDRSGNLIVVDGKRIRMVSPTGLVSTIAGAPGGNQNDGALAFSVPTGVAVDRAGNIYVADSGNHTIRRISTAGTLTTFAGIPDSPGVTDGPGISAQFDHPQGLAVDDADNIYVADAYNDTIRKITPGGVVSTFAGQAGAYGSTNGSRAEARFGFPAAVAVDRSGNVYVAENAAVRKIEANGVVSTLAGGAYGDADGVGTLACFRSPKGIAVDGAGYVFVADTSNNTIRKISPAGEVATIIGWARKSGSADGVGGNVRLHYPCGVAIDASGCLYVADTWNYTIRRSGSPIPPQIASQPLYQMDPAGRSATLTVAATGLPAPNLQWRHDGVPISGATSSTLTLTSFRGTAAGAYDVVITSQAGSITSAPTVLASRFTNFSVRGLAGTGDQTLILGFVVTGAGSKQVLIRGIGPTLRQFGVSEPLEDPMLELYSSGTKINENNDWNEAVSPNSLFTSVGAFPLPTGSKDAALYITLPPGAFTAHLRSAGRTGVALLEAYDADTATHTAWFSNISVRNQVGVGDQILILGLYLTGNMPKTVLIRGIGPTLTAFGVAGVLGDPKIQLLSGDATIGTNDNWGGSTTLRAAFAAVGAFPLSSASWDSALIATLLPGTTYTLHLSGSSGSSVTTGVALVEVYEMP